MADKILYLTGVSKFAQVYPRNWDSKYERYSINLKLDDVSKVALRASGSQVKPKEFPDTEGIYYKFSRDHKKTFMDGTEKVFGPPMVTTGEGEALTFFDQDIGDGSKVSVKVTVYTTKAGYVGTRLEKVNVLEHVPYVPKGQQEEDTSKPSF